MKTKAFFLSAASLLLLSSAISLAQNGKLAIGVHYDAGVIQYQPVYSYLGEGDFVDFHSPATPQNFRAYVELPLKRNFRLRLAAGYGATQERYKGSILDYETAGYKIAQFGPIFLAGSGYSFCFQSCCHH